MKKKINIVLLLFVLCLWGTVLYRYVNQYFIKNEPLAVANTKNFSAKDEILKKDTFELKTIVRDPFLGSYAGVGKQTMRSKRVLPKKEKKETPKVTYKALFPNVRYFGYIKSIDNKAQETALLSIDGKFLRLHLNENRDGLKITTLTKDSIKVSYNKESKWVRVRKK